MADDNPYGRVSTSTLKVCESLNQHLRGHLRINVEACRKAWSSAEVDDVLWDKRNALSIPNVGITNAEDYLVVLVEPSVNGKTDPTGVSSMTDNATCL